MDDIMVSRQKYTYIQQQPRKYMTDQYLEQESYGINTQRRAKRRDLFQTATMTRNMFQTSSNLNEYRDQLEQVPQRSVRVQKNQDTAIQVPMANKIKIQKDAVPGQTKIIQIKSQQKSSIASNEIKKKQKKSEPSNGFIFEGSDTDQQDQNNHQEIKIESGQIIFEDNSHDEQQQQTKKPDPQPEKPGKKTISLFGQKIQVDQELLNDNDPTPQEKTTKLQLPPPPKPPQGKSLLKASTAMGENVFAKMKLQRIKASGTTTFILSLQANSRFILACKHTSSQTYIISENPDIFEENGPDYVGKIKTTFFGNELSLYSKGLNPQKSKQKKVIPRELICTVITHSQQLMQEVKPRDFTVYLLKNGVNYYKDLLGTVMYEEQVPLNKLYNDYESNKSKIWFYENRKSKWQQKQKMYSLNMKGRAKLPSIKNFVLESPAQDGRDIMLLGKMAQNQFSLDIHHPISPTIGLAIALTSFTHKSW